MNKNIIISVNSGKHAHLRVVPLSGFKKIVAEGRKRSISKIRKRKAVKAFGHKILLGVRKLFKRH